MTTLQLKKAYIMNKDHRFYGQIKQEYLFMTTILFLSTNNYPSPQHNKDDRDKRNSLIIKGNKKGRLQVPTSVSL